MEGGIYEISNFSVKVYNGDETYRAIRTPKHIYFNNDTICTKKTEDGLNIQPISLDLYCLHDLESFKNDNRFLIGEFIDCEPDYISSTLLNPWLTTYFFFHRYCRSDSWQTNKV